MEFLRTTGRKTMKSPYTTVEGTQFDAGVLPPGPLQPVILETKRELPDPYMEHLVSLHGSPELSEAENSEVSSLIGERMGLNQRASAIFERVRTRSREKITVEWEAAKAAVRAQQEKLREHHEQISQLQRQLNIANEAKSLAFAARDSAAEEKRRLNRYAEKRESDKANSLLVKREAEASHAAQEHGTLQQQINFMTLTELKPIMEELNRLMGEEARLAHFVTGAGYTNELGIVVPARPPL
jgi:hypothetical protein